MLAASTRWPDELGCDWHTVNDTVITYGTALLDADPERFGDVRPSGSTRC